jgi:hypothetical protein
MFMWQRPRHETGTRDKEGCQLKLQSNKLKQACKYHSGLFIERDVLVPDDIGVLC